MLAGNEAVLRARFEDAQFFYSKDRQHKLESFRPQLRTTTFQQGLGSMLDKSERVEQLVGQLGSLTSQPAGAPGQHITILAVHPVTITKALWQEQLITSCTLSIADAAGL